GNIGFQTVRNGKYIDKSGLIALVNASLCTVNKLTLVSRPRRFGKSLAAKMLCAYYDRTVDSSPLFDDLAIAQDGSYKRHLNQYNVLLLDITAFSLDAPRAERLPEAIQEQVGEEIKKLFPGADSSTSFTGRLADIVESTGRQFIAVIDEWDAPIRDRSVTEATKKKYLEFLRSLFKNQNVTDKVFAGAYMTGILPVKKDGSQSAISEFREYPVTAPGIFAKSVGFTEEEVQGLCKEFSINFADMKRWYDGYSFPGTPSIYNPNSVMRAIDNHAFASYWKQSSATDSLLHYIGMDYSGMSDAVRNLLAGKSVGVNIRMFQNDITEFQGLDDVLTLLIHFGYLSYDQENETARIPNEEIRMEFEDCIRHVTLPETVRRVRESDELIRATIAGDEEAVARQLEKIHEEESSPLFYNNEQTLRATVKLAYFAYRDAYIQMEELPGGKGYADIVYFPKAGIGYPALLIELKADGTDADGAIGQIKANNYPAALKAYDVPILLVGISYDKKTRKHSCRIELHGDTD
ncbi:MAG: AAA family ATPase, partial [Treponema sp.]|nr:AAA family ATPase [Treponema sp.]